ncbi:hypothetical protein [Salinimonas sediminis]|uniref:CPBP family intramembrane metalloprotease n=1 Tax=Salinimonas sediminis TaxID=2303538 RepID=A0A346NQ08_9ALTE|nr:hypothetical protein [Salinimonas sediminis]AXR07615.1 hypothetical protein D0Y50_15365 [Salinimonas sediminis]
MNKLTLTKYYFLFMETAQTSVAKSALYMSLLTLILCSGALAIINIFHDFQHGQVWMDAPPAIVLFVLLVILAPTLETALLATFVIIFQKVRVENTIIASLFALVMAYFHSEDPVRGIIVTIPFFLWTYFYASTRKKLTDRAWKIIFFAHAFHNAAIVMIVTAEPAFT